MQALRCRRARRRSGRHATATSAIIASNDSRVTVTPPWRSASVTTPIGIEIQASISGCGGPCCVGAQRPSRTSSDEPPPMSNRITPSAAGSTSGVQPVAASRASVSRSTISSSMPTSLRMRSRNSRPLLGRAAGLGRDQPRAGDAAVAHLVAADAQAPRPRAGSRPRSARPELVMPSPSRMMRENASTTRKLSRVGARHQQPAIVGAEIERGIGRAGHIQPALPAAVMAALARMPIRRPPAPPGPLRAPGQARGRGRSPGPRRPSQTFPRAEALSSQPGSTARR